MTPSPAQVCAGDDVRNILDPNVDLTSRRRDERVESKRGHGTADGIHAQVGVDGAQIAVAALPVEGEDLDVAFHDGLHEDKRQVGLAGAASAGDQDMLFQPPALERGGVQSASGVYNAAERQVAGFGE